ncbi:hypothetical protein EON70_00310 [bacterium]|nr:MAG: hypothetical protein EON70_00310 [bacterium]
MFVQNKTVRTMQKLRCAKTKLCKNFVVQKRSCAKTKLCKNEVVQKRSFCNATQRNATQRTNFVLLR